MKTLLSTLTFMTAIVQSRAVEPGAQEVFHGWSRSPKLLDGGAGA